MFDKKISCHNCGTEISSSGTFCPKCGNKIQLTQEEETNSQKSFISKNIMWGIIALIAIGLSVILLTGTTIYSNQSAGSSNVTQTNKNFVQDPTIATVETKEQMNSKVFDLANVINGKSSQWCCCNCGSTYKNHTAPKGYIYLAALISVKNKGVSIISTNPNNWKLTADSISYIPDVATFALKQPISEVEYNGQAAFAVIYLVQGNPSTAQLTYTG